MLRESKKDKLARTRKIIKLLTKEFPDAKCSLDHKNPLELLVATILAAQCTDVRVNIVTKDLFKKYKAANDFANADPEIFSQEIKSTGFFRNKSKNIISASKVMVDSFGGKVPDTMEGLLSLPGVARKTANVVLSNAFGKNEGVVVDTHVTRLSGRLGLSKHKAPVKIEKDLMELVDQKLWGDFSHLLVFHGRNYCKARNPDCESCPLNQICPSAFKC